MQSSQNVTRKFSDETNVPFDVKKDVERLISEGNTNITSNLISKLRAKYPDNNIVDMIIESLSEKVSKISSRAIKFAQAIIKHSGANTPLHTMLKRALKYREKLNLSDAEFELFKQHLYKQLNNPTDQQTMYTQGYTPGNTNMSRALGSIGIEQNEGIQIEQHDFPYLQEIIKHNAISKPTHASVVMQHYLYREYAGEAMLGTYDQNKHNAACHIHPIIAAMFLPKIDIFEQTFLLANISYIVRCRYEKTPIMTISDYILMNALISDPTDVVCDLESPFKDLRNRAILQETLWQSVLALRNGRYYDCVSAQFLSAVDQCKLSNVDAPDVIYVGDEATVIRRLLQAFSFRPIIVSTMPLYGVVAANSANFPVMMNRVSAIPMITVRLPIITNADQSIVSLEQSLSLPQYYLENNTLVPKVQTIIYTRGVIIFHVARRIQRPNYQAMIEPQNWKSLLPTISAYERINTRNVVAEDFIDVGLSSSNGDARFTTSGTGRHWLKSVVVLNVNPLIPDLIVGTAAIFIKSSDPSRMTSSTSYYKYDPQMAAIKRSNEDYSTTRFNPPVVAIWQNHEEVPLSFDDLSAKYGTIYIYATEGQTNEANIERQM